MGGVGCDRLQTSTTTTTNTCNSPETTNTLLIILHVCPTYQTPETSLSSPLPRRSNLPNAKDLSLLHPYHFGLTHQTSYLHPPLRYSHNTALHISTLPHSPIPLSPLLLHEEALNATILHLVLTGSLLRRCSRLSCANWITTTNTMVCALLQRSTIYDSTVTFYPHRCSSGRTVTPKMNRLLQQRRDRRISCPTSFDQLFSLCPRVAASSLTTWYLSVATIHQVTKDGGPAAKTWRDRHGKSLMVVFFLSSSRVSSLTILRLTMLAWCSDVFQFPAGRADKVFYFLQHGAGKYHIWAEDVPHALISLSMLTGLTKEHLEVCETDSWILNSPAATVAKLNLVCATVSMRYFFADEKRV